MSKVQSDFHSSALFTFSSLAQFSSRVQMQDQTSNDDKKITIVTYLRFTPAPLQSLSAQSCRDLAANWGLVREGVWGPFQAVGLQISVIISCSFSVKSRAWETASWVLFPSALAFLWFLKFWVAAFISDPHLKTLGQPRSPQYETQKACTELTDSPVSSSEEGCISQCVFSFLWFSSCDGIRGGRGEEWKRKHCPPQKQLSS